MGLKNRLEKLVAIRMPIKLVADLRQLAGSDRRTLSAYIRISLENHVLQAKERKV